MRNLISRAALAAGALAFGIAGANAATATGSLSVTANVLANCTVSSTAVSFGTVPSNITAAQNATGSVDVVCAGITPTSIGLSDGLNPGGGSPAQRNMAGATLSTNLLPYDLSAASSGGATWRATSGGPTTVFGTHSYPVYGQIPGTAGIVTPDNYSDTVTITVNY
ncbi:MAG: spore coat U domain-containing protein [Rhodomicrobium sp.]